MKRFAVLLLIVIASASVSPSPNAAETSPHVTPPKTGQQAPGFTLRDQNGKRMSLAAAAGAKVVLVFYRGYW
jgi:cytochrome oxidase Cu insertion factor (SCO1/SenC/PrrC family)